MPRFGIGSGPMFTRRALPFFALLAISCSSGRSSDTTDASTNAALQMPERAIVADLHRTFKMPLDGDKVLDPIVHGGARIVRTDKGLIPEVKLPERANGKLARLRLPNVASEPFTLAQDDLSIDVTLLGASNAPARIESDAVVYENALENATLVHIPTHAGTEEYVRYDARPADRALHYSVRLNGVAGVRVVGDGVVELLDATGNPVLRTTAPQVFDSNGKGKVGTIDVEGCKYDSSDIEPWGRAVTPPGSSTCTVHARWNDDGLTYPLLVDPPWTNTGSLAYKRRSHAATKITGSSYASCVKGCVLVVGGLLSSNAYVGYAEFFNGSTGTFAAIPGYGRTNHALVDLENGTALTISGNYSDTGIIASCAAYQPGTGWLSRAALPAARKEHAAVGKSAKAWVTGGRDSADVVQNTAWKYDYAANAWTAIDGMYQARRSHAMVYVNRSGAHSAVAAGGYTTDGSALNTAESITSLEDTTKFWTKATGTMSGTRTSFVGIAEGAYVFFTGGGNSNVDRYTVGGTDSVEPWIVAATTITATNNFGLEGGTLKSGSTTRLAVFGGSQIFTTSGASRNTYLWNPAASTVAAASQTATMNAGRSSFAAATIIDGTTWKQLAIGGTSCSFLSGKSSCTYPTYEEILALMPNGEACSSDSTCASGMCRDGVCCNADCAGQCQYCKDSGSIGTCKTITGVPRAPRSACPAPNTGVCGYQCNGANATACEAPTTSCGAATCSGGYQTTQSVCSGTGACTAGSKTACGKYACNTTACFTSCTTNTQCAAGYRCDVTGLCVSSGLPGAECAITSDCQAGNYCVDFVCCTTSSCSSGMKCNNAGAMGTCKLPYGSACTTSTAASCPTGFCADGVCCDSACTGQCEQCSGSGACLPVPSGSSPAAGHTPCTGTGSCQSKCDGSTRTACGPFPNTTTVCAAASCNPTARTATPTRYCDGLGACPSAAASSCGGYTCDTTACRTSCVDSTACAAGYYCGGGVCVPTGAAGTACSDGAQCSTGFCVDGACCTASSCPSGFSCSATSTGVCKKAVGTACATTTECGSGFCVDGVCCDGACGGQCEACNVGGSEGLCSAVVGAPKGTRAACTGTGTCAAQCDGSNRTSCAAPPGTLTVCGAETCSGGSWTKTSTCNGAGACVSPSPVSCVPYVCGTTSCKTSCFASTDCASGYACKDGICVTTGELGTLCADATQCKSGKCTAGPGGKNVCCTVDSCASGTVCADTTTPDVVGTCVKLKGGTCTSKNECTTGFCIDGVCCDSVCTGQCEACDVTGAEGTCSPIIGAPHGSRTKCFDGGGDPCKALTCDPSKDRTKCAGFLSGAESECGEASCIDGTATPRGRCDGMGACTPSTNKTSCGNYACEGNSCRTSCTTKADCAPLNNCVDGKCATITAKCDEAGTSSVPTNGDATKTCAPYRCDPSTGNCFGKCTTSADCAAGAACGSDGVCVPPAAAGSSEDSGGCSTSQSPSRSPFVGLMLAAIALAAVGRARRRVG
jgi:hypothetical protein